MIYKPAHMSLLKTIAIDAEDHPWAKLAAAVIFKKRLVSIGTNRMKSHPFQLKYRKNKDAIFLHAEIAAIKNALKVLNADQLRHSALYVCRVKKKDRNDPNWYTGLAKPCSGCQKAIAEFGIKHVFYTLDLDDNVEIL